MITGAGRVFSAGADLQGMAEGLGDAPEWERLSAAVAGFRGLSVAALNGTLAGGAFLAPVRRFAIGLGCEVQHAGALVYADGLDLKGRFEPIGISCRICERRECHQRSVPPLERRLKVDPDKRGLLPYQIAD